MNNRFRFLAYLWLLLVPLFSLANDTLEKDLNDILKLRLSPDEAIDSICTFLPLPDNHTTDSLQAAKAESFINERAVKFGVKNNCSPKMMAQLFDILGLMCTHQGPNKIDDARLAFDKALEYSEVAGDEYMQGVIFEHKSQVEAKFGDMAKGFEFTEEAIRRYKKSGAIAERRIIRSYYTQAVAYLQGMDLEGMRRVIDSIAAFSRRVTEENRIHALYNLYSVEEAYYGTKSQMVESPSERNAFLDSMNQVSLASVLLIDANYNKWKNTSIDPTWNYYNRAVLFLNLSDRPNIDSIEYYLNKAITVEIERHTHSVEVQISAASVRAEMWMKYGDYEKAKNILLDAIKMLDGTEGINNVVYDKIEIYKNLVDISKQSGHFEEALKYAELLSAAEKERFSAEKAKDIKELEIKYKTQETQLALAQSEAKRANTLMWLFAALGLLLIAVICFVIYADRQRRHRMRKEMEFANLKAETSRQLTQQYVEGLENERQRMSRELHDGVCNDLLAIQMNIKSGKSLESTADLLDSCRESVRRISHELMPPEFSYASIDEVVRFFVLKQKNAHEGKIDIKFDSVIDSNSSWQEVSDVVSLEVYRIIQEAVGNAIKHSGASEINVSLRLEDNLLKAEIQDNGTFKSGEKKGLGLESIKRRAKSVNGTAEIISDEKSFTKLLVRIPLIQ